MDNRHFTILLAEDDANDALLIKRALAKNGIGNPLQIAPDGEEAIAYLSGAGKYGNRAEYPFPQFFITDLKMPRKSGFEVLSWLQEHPDCLVVPTIVLSSSKQHEDIKKAYQLGANSYLTKPADFTQLQELIKKVFDYWTTCERPEMREIA
jgi:CheY-like chemotaxis protein